MTLPCCWISGRRGLQGGQSVSLPGPAVADRLRFQVGTHVGGLP